MSEYERLMTPGEEDLADLVYTAVQNASNFSERSQQSSDFRIGISDLGYCSEKVRRMVAGIPEPVTDKLPAFIGTALGDHIEAACMAAWPNAIRQPAVTVTLHGDGGDYLVSGHPDLVLPEGKVIDFKTARGLSVVRRTGPSQQQQFQRHSYALGAYEAGLFDPGVGIGDIKVANVWMDRAGDERRLHCHMEPLSFDVVNAAAAWLDDVAYSYLHENVARKEPPVEVCRKSCGHFPNCRLLDLTGGGGLLTDDSVLASVDLYNEAVDMEREARRMKDQARAHLDGVEGSTGKYQVKWVHVGGSHVEYDRQPYEKLDVRPI